MAQQHQLVCFCKSIDTVSLCHLPAYILQLYLLVSFMMRTQVNSVLSQRRQHEEAPLLHRQVIFNHQLTTKHCLVVFKCTVSDGKCGT